MVHEKPGNFFFVLMRPFWGIFLKETSFLFYIELRQYKNDSMKSKCILVLKLPRFFPSPYTRVKTRGNFKTNILLVDSIS